MSEREIVNCELCNSFLHKTQDCPKFVRFKTTFGWIVLKKRKENKPIKKGGAKE